MARLRDKLGPVPVLVSALVLSESVSSQADNGLGPDLAWLALLGATCCAHVSNQAPESSKTDRTSSPLRHPPCQTVQACVALRCK